MHVGRWFFVIKKFQTSIKWRTRSNVFSIYDLYLKNRNRHRYRDCWENRNRNRHRLLKKIEKKPKPTLAKQIDIDPSLLSVVRMNHGKIIDETADTVSYIIPIDFAANYRLLLFALLWRLYRRILNLLDQAQNKFKTRLLTFSYLQRACAPATSKPESVTAQPKYTNPPKRWTARRTKASPRQMTKTVGAIGWVDANPCNAWFKMKFNWHWATQIPIGRRSYDWSTASSHGLEN